jgi:TRAP-type C4-dicarboxylate transport system permease small subunit
MTMDEIDDAPVASPETIRRLMLFAVILSIASTATAFWLSYEHLHDVASGHGLSAARAWAWPGTVDTFIIIGEVMILVANLLRRTDGWAICVTVIGSVGSVALNVAGVGAHAAIMTYIVAAVPPCGALMSFAILMRQIKKVLTPRRDEAEPSADATTDQPIADDGAADGSRPPVVGKTVDPTPPDATEAARSVVESTPSVDLPDASPVAASVVERPAQPPTTRRPKATRSATGKRPPRRSLDEWVEIAGPIFHAEFQRLRRKPTANEFAQAIDRAGFGLPSDTVAKTIRSEILDRADVPALSEEGQ